MIILLLILALTSIYGLRFSSFHADYMQPAQTTAIKGIFAVIILLSHMSGYVHWSTGLDVLGYKIIGLIGQLMVTMFFFYSGFGILESWRRKPDYAKNFFRQRFLKILVHFDLALVLYAILNVLLGISYSVIDYLLCWIGWGSIGNSNWFVFDTLAFYLLTLAAMYIGRKARLHEKSFCLIITILCIALWYVLKQVRGLQEEWWYNTIFCFPAGIWYSVFKEKVDTFARKTVLWLLGLVVLAAIFLALYFSNGVLSYTLCSAVFCVLVVWVTMKLKLCNNVLGWLGTNSFSIYILQRIPMIIFSHFGLNSKPYVFAALVIFSIFPLSAGFTWILNRIDRRIFRKM